MRGIVFDLDGTLIDSEPDLRAALNRLLADRGLSPLDPAAVRSMIGDGAAKLVERGFAAHGRSSGPAELDEFLEDYEANAAVATVAYPGVAEALRVLAARGYKMAVCTNKPERAARSVLAALRLEPFFEAVCGGDGAYRKPDPRHLGEALTALGEAAGVMIGDHENDQAAARGLGMPFIFAAWGYGTAEGDAIARQPGDVPELVAKLASAELL